MNEPGARPAAPEPLRLVQSFANTVDREAGHDALASLDGLRGWLESEHLVERGVELSASAVGQARAVREGLRALAGGNNGVPPDRDVLALLDATIQELGIAVSLTAEGSFALVAPAPFGQAMAGILDIVRTAMDDGCWQRLKACRRPVCRWVFYDASRNRSSHWCSMEVCGNRVKSRSAYQRRRSRTSREPATAG